jgi:hypothetical protein
MVRPLLCAEAGSVNASDDRICGRIQGQVRIITEVSYYHPL